MTDNKWVWRPRWPRSSTATDQSPKLPATAANVLEGCNRRPRRRTAPRISWFVLTVAMLLLMFKESQALGFFELQILEIENYRGQLATGECCGMQQSSPPKYNCIGAPQCNTLFRVCLREYQSRQPPAGSPSSASSSSSVSSSSLSSTSTTGLSNQLHCSFGNTSSPVLGGNSFTLTGGDSDSSDSRGNLALPFSFSWTRSFTFILQAMDYNNYTGALSVIEEATYSGILLPGNEWKALSHLGRTARMAYRVRVQCDRNYYGQTCTKLCKPRDDRFGHYTCGDTDGRKECIPGWQGETCDKAVCKTGCHPVHGKCDYPGGCECRKGWQGELCDQCMTYPGCKHGYCNGTSWQCICDINWGGILCDQDLNYCGTHEPCLNGGTCKSTAPDKYTCTCPEGFSGSNCDVVLNPCATEPCLNGGKCNTVSVPNPMAGGSALGSLQLPKQFHCDCQPGWTGSTCNTEIDECALGQPRCLNGGTCVDKLNDWLCLCPEPWWGRQCEIDVDECERQQQQQQHNHIACGPNAIPCKTGGNSTECVCRKGWTVSNGTSNFNAPATGGCTVNIDDCAIGSDLKCFNGGTCIDLIGSYSCICPIGFTGRNCRTQVDPCDNGSALNPCKNGGECVRTVAAGSSKLYSCICPLGYSGENCEINRDHCAPNPCRNGGQCLNTPDDYYCHCSTTTDGLSWHGKNCTLPRKRTQSGSPTSTATASTTTTRPAAATVLRDQQFPAGGKVTTGNRDPLDNVDRDYYYYNRTASAGSQTCGDIGACLNGGTCIAIASTEYGGATDGPTVRRGNGSSAGGSRNQNSYKCRCPQGYSGARCEDDTAFPVHTPEQQYNNGPVRRPTHSKPVYLEYDDDNGNVNDDVNISDDDDDDYDNSQIQGAMCTTTSNKHWPAVGSNNSCNECKCVGDNNGDDNDSLSAVLCTNLWCGPQDCLNGGSPCNVNQICVPIIENSEDTGAYSMWQHCLKPPCNDDIKHNHHYNKRPVATRGQCITKISNDHLSAPISIWPLSVRHCLPNHEHQLSKHQNSDCGRMLVTLDANRLRRGTRVTHVCHILRRLVSQAWILENSNKLRSTKVYVMCELSSVDYGLDNHVKIQVSVAVDKQTAESDPISSSSVQHAVETLYRKLQNDTDIIGLKKGHRDISSLFLTAVVDTVLFNVTAESTSLPPNVLQESLNDYRYYYWTGVACGSLTILAICILLRFVYQQWWKRRDRNSMASGTRKTEESTSSALSSSNNNLMLSLVQRQNEENLKRTKTYAANSNKLNYSCPTNGNNLSLVGGSSLSCSRVSIVHPLCNTTSPNGGQNDEGHHKQLLEMYENKTGVVGANIIDQSSINDKTNVMDNAAIKSIATTNATTVAPQQLCKKTQNVEYQQQQQQQQQLQQQQQQLQHQNAVHRIIMQQPHNVVQPQQPQQQQLNQHSVQVHQSQYHHQNHPQAIAAHQQQQQHYALHPQSSPVPIAPIQRSNNNIVNNGSDRSSLVVVKDDVLTVLV